MAQNFDGGKYWRIWQIFINLSTFYPSKFSTDNLLPFACHPDHFFMQGIIVLYAPMQLFSLSTINYISMVAEQKCHSFQYLDIYFISSLYYNNTNRHLQLRVQLTLA